MLRPQSARYVHVSGLLTSLPRDDQPTPTTRSIPPNPPLREPPASHNRAAVGAVVAATLDSALKERLRAVLDRQPVTEAELRKLAEEGRACALILGAQLEEQAPARRALRRPGELARRRRRRAAGRERAET